MNKNREWLLNFYMENPCLSVEVDHENRVTRLEHYTELIQDMSEDEVIEEIWNAKQWLKIE